MTDTTPSNAAPVWGAPTPPPASKKTKQTLRELQRQEVFKRNAERPVPWTETIRTASSTAGGYGHINFEGVYKGFRQRLLEDEAFEHEILEMILERLMSELYVPLNHRPQAGLKLKICRKPTAKGE